MHDGRFATLEQVIEHYSTPFEASQTLDPNLAKHPQGLGLSPEDQARLDRLLEDPIRRVRGLSMSLRGGRTSSASRFPSRSHRDDEAFEEICLKSVQTPGALSFREATRP